MQVFIVYSLNYEYDIGELSVTQKLGIITCLPKGNKPPETNISSDQTGFISGRYIGENIRLIYDI